MPNLPVSENDQNSEVLNKRTLSTGVLERAVPPKKKIHLKIPKKLIICLFMLVVVLGVMYLAVSKIAPNLLTMQLKQKQLELAQLEVPVDVTKIIFPSDSNKQTFLLNFKDAKETTDPDQRFNLLEANFTLLNGFYGQNHAYDNRLELAKFRDYIKSKYPDKYKANQKLYDFACVDLKCSDNKYTPEAQDIKNQVELNTVISPFIKESIYRDLDAASAYEDKLAQGDAYVNIISSLYSEYQNKKDDSIKSLYSKVYVYVKKQYPENFIPDGIIIK